MTSSPIRLWLGRDESRDSKFHNDIDSFSRYGKKQLSERETASHASNN
jgi:hypothetical protein